MLQLLRVTNLGVIEEAEIELGPGLIALTGETGAGKTMVVSAIELLLGGRSTPEMIRENSQSATVSGVFVNEGIETILSREISRNGRSRAYLNGRLTSVSELVDFAGPLVEQFGQGLANSLQRPASQLEILDMAAQLDTSEMKLIQQRVREISRQLSDLELGESMRLQRIDLLRFQVDEIDRADLADPEEETQLEAQAAILSNASEIKEAVNSAFNLLSHEVEGGARDLVATASHLLEKIEFVTDLRKRLESVVAELDDVRSDLREVLSTVNEDPALLDTIRSRIKLLSELKRKYGPSLAQVIGHYDSATAELALLTDASTTKESLQASFEEANRELEEESSKVRAARIDAAKQISLKLSERLKQLSLPSARFLIEVGEHGDGSPISFLFSANPGMAPHPMAKVASGGEISRVMLAICLVANRGASTMVFDEIDAGIGGETALQVGRALSELGMDRQVIVVTHLPQVAAFADQQIRIRKSIDGQTTRTDLETIEQAERAGEIARMLSGHSNSEVAISHAVELLSIARRSRE